MMSEVDGTVEEDIPNLATTSMTHGVEINAITGRGYNMVQRAEIRRRNYSLATILADPSSLVKARVVDDPIFAPVRKLPAELLSDIFFQCIPPLGFIDSATIHNRSGRLFQHGMHPQQVRSRLGTVCRAWNNILNNESRVWATLAFNESPTAPEIVFLKTWIKRSKARPLDVFIYSSSRRGNGARELSDGIQALAMLHKELWRIRCFIAYVHDNRVISALFPPLLSTDAPIMQSLILLCKGTGIKSRLGDIHTPALHTLAISYFDEAVKPMIIKPMANVRHLDVTFDGPIRSYLKLLNALPNLVSLSWTDFRDQIDDEPPTVVLRSLKSLIMRSNGVDIDTRFLASLYVPSLENLDLLSYEHCYSGILDRAMGAICGDGTVQLRHLVLCDITLLGANFPTILHYLKHLETLFVQDGESSADNLLIALSPHNIDFNSPCPKLETVELSFVDISPGPLVDFVQRRVKSDLDDPRPCLVTCLKLSDVCISKELCAQLAKTHSSSIHLAPVEEYEE